MFKKRIVKLYRFVIQVFDNLITKESSSHKLSLSFCIGLYIAFSPFLFMHTIMVIIFSWALSLNYAAVFAGAFVNNPWTIVPCHTAGYVVGEFFLRTICKIDSIACNPSWMKFVNEPIFKITGLHGISFWSFMVGGNLLGLLVGVILYPVLKPIFARMGMRMYKGAKKTTVGKNEDCCTKQKSISRLRYSRETGSRHSSYR